MELVLDDVNENTFKSTFPTYDYNKFLNDMEYFKRLNIRSWGFDNYLVFVSENKCEIYYTEDVPF
jgi:hypothetical protein